MKDFIRGKVYVLGNDIDTDQIIPAQHLVYSLSDPEERKQYGRYALSSVPDGLAGLPAGNVRFVNEGECLSQFNIIIAGKNFGCGSSREHAPVALNIAGVEAVVAESYARIFYRNSFNMGLPIFESADASEKIKEGDEIELDPSTGVIHNLTKKEKYRARPIPPFMQALINAGGLMNYVKRKVA